MRFDDASPSGAEARLLRFAGGETPGERESAETRRESLSALTLRELAASYELSREQTDYLRAHPAFQAGLMQRESLALSTDEDVDMHEMVRSMIDAALQGDDAAITDTGPGTPEARRAWADALSNRILDRYASTLGPDLTAWARGQVAAIAEAIGEARSLEAAGVMEDGELDAGATLRESLLIRRIGVSLPSIADRPPEQRTPSDTATLQQLAFLLGRRLRTGGGLGEPLRVGRISHSGTGYTLHMEAMRSGAPAGFATIDLSTGSVTVGPEYLRAA
jgi:hypothetical protein